MTDNQSLPFTIEELGKPFGAQLGIAFAKIIVLEKQLAPQTLIIQSMTANEATLLDRIHELEKQLHQAQCDVLAAQGKAIIDQHEK